jgi:hypothetical protein
MVLGMGLATGMSPLTRTSAMVVASALKSVPPKSSRWVRTRLTSSAKNPSHLRNQRSTRRSSIAALLADLAMVQNQHLVWESVNLRPSLILKDGNFNSVRDDLISWRKFIFTPLESPAACSGNGNYPFFSERGD